MADPTDQEIDPLVPRQQPADPNAAARMIKALAGGMVPDLSYLQAPTGPTSFQPNAAGKIPSPDPLAGVDKYARGAFDLATTIPGVPESLVGKGAALAALHLLPKYKTAGGSFLQEAEHAVLNDAGEHVLDLSSTYYPESRLLNVDWLGDRRLTTDPETDPSKRYSNYANSLGPAEMKSLLKALMNEYPEMELLSGERISGSRLAAGLKDKNVSMRVRKPKAE